MLPHDAKDYRNGGAAYSWKTFKHTVDCSATAPQGSQSTLKNAFIF